MRPARTPIILSTDDIAAIERLIAIARRDTGQSRKVADFLLAWHNAAENGGWDPTDLWTVDEQIMRDMVTVLGVVIGNHGKYLNDLGYAKEIGEIWTAWRRA